MNQLSIFVDTSTDTEAIRRQLAGVFELQFRPLDQIHDMAPEPYIVFDVNMHDGRHLLKTKEWLKRKPKGGKTVFVIDETSRTDKVQAHALGATDVIHRPIDGKALLTLLWGNFDSLSVDAAEPRLKSDPAVGPAFDALENVFASACLGAPLDLQKVHTAGEVLVDCIESQGLGSWISTVRKHHSLTYQHSLVVTGVAVAFGQHLGFSKKDCQRLSFAGMLHDIGKARIPVAILEKPGPLDKDELIVMRKHPEYGLDALKSVPGG